MVRSSRSPLVLVTLTIVFAACASPPSDDQGGTAASQAQLSVSDQLLLASAKVALPPQGVVPEDLPQPESGGATALRRYCMTCHALPDPRTHSATDWPAVVRRMWLRTEKIPPSFNVPVPNTGERIAILQYLVNNAFKVSAAQLPAGPGRETFSVTCSRCHELADPRQHSPEDWVAVVRRMSGHMEDMLGESLAPEKISEISMYLSSASRVR